MTEFQKTMKKLGGRARITGDYGSVSGFGKARPGETPRSGYPMDRGVAVDFPNGYRMEAGYRLVRARPDAPARFFADSPRRDREIWKDAESDFLGHWEEWYSPEGTSVPNPAGETYSSLGEFFLKACASGVFAG